MSWLSTQEWMSSASEFRICWGSCCTEASSTSIACCSLSLLTLGQHPTLTSALAQAMEP